MSHVWDEHARWWQNAFTDGADPEYVDQIIPLANSLLGESHLVLDVGTGDGQIARSLAHNSRVVAIDPSTAQLKIAAQRAGQVRYSQALGEHLPFASRSFDAAIACLVFEHTPDAGASIAEIARVLQPGGRFVLFLNHPLLQCPDSGFINDHILNEQYWRVGPYLQERELLEEVTAGVKITFYHRPLSYYLNHLAANGLFLTGMLEPKPPDSFLDQSEGFEIYNQIPRLAVLVTQKLA